MRSIANRYLVTPSGRFVGTAKTAAWLTFVPGALAVASIALGFAAIDKPPLAIAGILLFVLLAFASGGFNLWAVLANRAGVARAGRMWLAGDFASATALCHRALLCVFRRDVRAKALHVLGLIAEAQGAFEEAADLFARAYEELPNTAGPAQMRRARLLIRAHQALSLVALGRLGEADAALRDAWEQLPLERPNAGVIASALDRADRALRIEDDPFDLEPDRDPHAVISLARVVVLDAMGLPREAIRISEEQHAPLDRGLLPREKTLLLRVVRRAHVLVAAESGAGPHRVSALADDARTNDEVWAQRVMRSAL
jgi:tetratricopeptide (TPR) repeat protein